MLLSREFLFSKNAILTIMIGVGMTCLLGTPLPRAPQTAAPQDIDGIR
jgi:hypothetical protein